jgi:2,3-bisphosphoglycerate-independent phosphoglycerate mutase
MKSIIIIGDGMSDVPIASLNGRTPLMVAHKPSIDRIAREGCSGLVRTIGETGPADSAVANLAVLGYPVATSQGRAVFEAASMGVDIKDGEVALRCNLVCLSGDPVDYRIRNHSAGHISTEEAAQLIRSLDEVLGGGKGKRPVTFHTGISYRHLLVLNGDWASPKVACTPPHDYLDGRVAELLPKLTDGITDPKEMAAAEATAMRLVDLYRRSLQVLKSHPVNVARRVKGLDEATAIWTWSPGRRPAMETLPERFDIKPAVISAVDLIMGLGVYAGMDVIKVEGATGLHDTNYEGKAEAALAALADHDMVYVHVEASDEASHSLDLDLKIKCIEYLDQRLVKIILDGLETLNLEARVSILPDHPTPVETGKHGRDPVPMAISGPGIPADRITGYDERQAAAGSLGTLEGDSFIRLAVGAK